MENRTPPPASPSKALHEKELTDILEDIAREGKAKDLSHAFDEAANEDNKIKRRRMENTYASDAENAIITTSTLSGGANSMGSNRSATLSESAARDRDTSGSAAAAAGASAAGGAGAGRRGGYLSPIRYNTSEVHSPSQLSCEVRLGGGGDGGGSSSGAAGPLSSLLGTSISVAGGGGGGGYIPEPHQRSQPQPQNNLAGFSFPSTGMDAKKLQQHLKEFTQSLFSEGLLDDQFTELQMLQDESDPDFVARVVSLFFNDSEEVLEELTQSLESEPIDYEKVFEHVIRFQGSSSSIGAQRVKTGCISFCQCCKAEDLQGCHQALVEVKDEFLLVKTKLEAMLVLEQQVLAAGGTLRYSDLE